MDFNKISKLVAQKQELPEDADLIDQYAFHTLEIIYAQFKANYISQETATRRKENLIREYEKLKEQNRQSKEVFNRQLESIRTSEELRNKLNRASREGHMSKSLWLDAIKCIGAMCGSYAGYESCKEYLKNVEYEEQTRIEI